MISSLYPICPSKYTLRISNAEILNSGMSWLQWINPAVAYQAADTVVTFIVPVKTVASRLNDRFQIQQLGPLLEHTNLVYF